MPKFGPARLIKLRLRVMRMEALARFAIIALVGLAIVQGWLNPVQHVIEDLRFRILQRDVGRDLLLVDIDEPSIAALGVWPWNRTVHAAILDRLIAAGAADVAFDVDFSSPSPGGGDATFAQALDRAGGGVMLATLQQTVANGPGKTAQVLARPIPVFADRSWEASVNVIPDDDGQVRSFSRAGTFGTQTIPSLATLLGGQAGRVGGDFLIDFGLDYTRLAHLSAIQLLRGSFEADLVRDRKVIVGASATELRDIFQVPRFGFISGAAVQAMAVESTLQNRALLPLSPPLTAAISIVLLGLVCLLSPRLPFGWSLALCAGVAVLAETAAVLVQWRWPIVPVTAPLHMGVMALAAVAVGDEGVQRRLKLLASRSQANRLRVMLDRVIADNFAGIVIVDQSSRIRAASAAAATLLGRPLDAEDGRHFHDVLPSRLADLVSNVQAHLTAGIVQPAVTCEVEIDRLSGPAVLLDCVTTVSDVAPPAEGGRISAREYAICLTFRDITAEREAHMRLVKMARTDAVSGLANRSVLLAALDERATVAPAQPQALVFLAIDRFKLINDRLGHGTGDALISAVAARMAGLVAADDVVARLGGDEFAVLLGRPGAGDVEALVATLARTVSGPYHIGIYQPTVTLSVGVVAIDRQGTTEAMAGADAALQAAKSAGGDTIRFYDAALKAKTEERSRLAHDLRHALADRQFEVVFQRQVDAVTEGIVGVEALVRWRHPEHGYISPSRFIPVAESTGLIEPIGTWVLDAACRAAVGWREPIKVSVNLSAQQLARADLADLVFATLAETGLPPGRLDLELTESLLMDDDDTIQVTLGRLRAAGVKISLDDFGTGYSSLAYLNTFAIDKVKIDQSFVRNLTDQRSASAVVRAVVSLARELDIRVNAEGVETVEQLHILQQLGCDEIQGYLHGRPEPSAAIEASLAALAAPHRPQMAAEERRSPTARGAETGPEGRLLEIDMVGGHASAT